MAGQNVPLDFGPGFMPDPSEFEFLSNPIDVSKFATATLVCWGGIVDASSGQTVTLTVQESRDRVNWVEPSVPRIRLLPGGTIEEETILGLNRPWLRAKAVFEAPAPGLPGVRPTFHAELRLKKREP